MGNNTQTIWGHTLTHDTKREGGEVREEGVREGGSEGRRE